MDTQVLSCLLLWSISDHADAKMEEDETSTQLLGGNHLQQTKAQPVLKRQELKINLQPELFWNR